MLKQLRKQLRKLIKEEIEKLRKEKSEKLRNENENQQLRKNNVVQDAEIKESIKKPKEIKSLVEDKNTTDYYPNWFDKNKFKNILAIIDRKNFSYKNKIGEFNYIDIKDLVNKMKNNTISEISAKTSLNNLNEIKNEGITKQRKRTPKQKELLDLLNDLSDTTLTDKTLKLESQEDNEIENENQNESINENVNENVNENENDETLMPSNEDNENDNETIDQNNSDKIKELNDHFDKIIYKSRSFEDQIESLKKQKIWMSIILLTILMIKS